MLLSCVHILTAPQFPALTHTALSHADHHPAPDPAQQLAGLHKALADPLRLTILRLLLDESFAVLELSRILDIRQSALSHHLKVLANAALVSTRREGNTIFYRRAFIAESETDQDLRQAVFEQIDRLPMTSEHGERIQQIRLERSRHSLDFFRRHADKFGEKQGLIVAHEEYAQNLHDLIDGLALNDPCTVLEVGPGEGQMLVELAARFPRLLALDNSPTMLERSRQAVARAGLDNVEFILGDTRVAREQGLSADLILFEMVLHHISSPAETLRDCRELLHPGGHLLIVELAPHDQDWARESCGDLWLGFEKRELERWAEQAGLQPRQASYLQLRNGFQIQLRLFTRPEATANRLEPLTNSEITH